MAFFYEHISDKTGISQYKDYLENQLYLHDLSRNVNDVTNYQLVEVRRAISRHSLAQQNSINSAVERVCSSLETGMSYIRHGLAQSNHHLKNIEQDLDDLNWQVAEVNSNLENLIYLLDDRLNQVIDQQKISNELLRKISTGIFISDRKKDGLIYCRQGNRFLKSAMIEGPASLNYNRAYIEFKNALLKDEFDCVALKQLGFICLHSKDHVDIPTALNFLLESASLALVADNDVPDNLMKKIASSAYYYASKCNYIQGNFDHAISNITLATILNPDNHYLRFQLAKYHAANNSIPDAIALLRELIEFNELFAVKIIEEQDLITKSAVREMLEKETAEQIRTVQEELSHIKAVIREDNPYLTLINKIERDFSPKTYVTARIARRKLEI